MNKQKIRTLSKTIRLNKTLKEILNLNKLIKNNLFSYFDFSNYKNIFIYLSCLEKGEVDTWQIINELKNHNIYVPCINKSSEMYLTVYNNIFIKNKYDIFECEGEKINTDIDIAIIPMLAFDITGNRIGFGKGYYDCFLSKLKNTTLIGLCMDPPFDKWIPESHDIPMDYVVTPIKIYRFNE